MTAKVNSRILSLVQHQRYECIAVICPRKDVITQQRVLRKEYGCTQWIHADIGLPQDMRELAEAYQKKMPSMKIVQEEGEDISVLYLGILHKLSKVKWQA